MEIQLVLAQSSMIYFSLLLIFSNYKNILTINIYLHTLSSGRWTRHKGDASKLKNNFIIYTDMGPDDQTNADTYNPHKYAHNNYSYYVPSWWYHHPY